MDIGNSDDDITMIADLFYELASPSRCAILYELSRREEMRLGEIAKALNLTMQETHRNISRLIASGLAIKNANGRFMITEYGTLAVRQLDYFKFVARHRDLLRFYSISSIPSIFINRLSEVVNCKVTKGVSAVLEKLKVLETSAEEYLNIIVAQAWYEEGNILIDRLSNSVNVKMIFTSNTIVPKEIMDTDIPRTMRGFEIKGVLQTRIVESVGAALYISERQAGVMLPNRSGIFDMNILFISSDKRFHGWCSDLFMHYWSSADDSTKGIERVVRVVD